MKFYTKIMKNRLLVIVFILIILIGPLLLIIYIMNTDNQNQLNLANTIGNQNALSLTMDKDVNRKISILQSLDSGTNGNSNENVNAEIVAINQALTEAEAEYEATLSSIESGQLITSGHPFKIQQYYTDLKPEIQSYEQTWESFRQSVDTVVAADDFNDQIFSEVSDVNQNNELLLQKSNHLVESLITYEHQTMNNYLVIVSIFFGSILFLLGWQFYHLYAMFILPMNEIYNRIFNYGSIKERKSFSISPNNKLTPVIKELNNGYDKLKKLIELIENMNQNSSFEDILNYIYNSFSQFIPYKHIGIALLKENNTVLEATHSISNEELGNLSKKMAGVSARIKDTSLWKIINQGTPRIINDLDTAMHNPGSTYNRIIYEAGIRSSITLPLNINNNPVGIIFFSCTKKNTYTEEHINFLKTISNSIAISLNKNIFIDELIYSTILALAKMAEARDEDTGEHLTRMKEYSKFITKFLSENSIYQDEISISFMKDIERFSPMHDIGKVGIRDGILLKPGKLTAEEFEEMKKHTIYGAEIMHAAEDNIRKQHRSLFKIGIEIALGHHEKYDGSGYPYHKKGRDIPLSARIVAVADVFDALTSKRPYKEALSFEQSFQMVIEEKNRQFDPVIIDCLLMHKPEFYQLYLALNKDLMNL